FKETAFAAWAGSSAWYTGCLIRASGRGTSGLQANYRAIGWPRDRKAAGSNPARSTTHKTEVIVGSLCRCGRTTLNEPTLYAFLLGRESVDVSLFPSKAT